MSADGDEQSIELSSDLPGGATLTLRVSHLDSDARQLLEAAATRAVAAARVALGPACAAIEQKRARADHGGEGSSSSVSRTIVGQSPAMARLFQKLERVAPSDASVLVTGENGTGKELVARAIHERSARSAGPFVATNCSAFNDNLLESELFGHRRGAFTGAVSDKQGLFETAHGGTFLLDEVGDMSPALQVKLLRVLQEGNFTPVGGTRTEQVDVRIIAATNRDLAQMVQRGSFREDLFYRLHVVELQTPPLRERGDDILRLIAHFAASLKDRYGSRKTLEPETLARLLAHSWPGNVRELENEIERIWVLSGDASTIDETLLNASLREAELTQEQIAAARRQLTSSGAGPLDAPGKVPEHASSSPKSPIETTLALPEHASLPDALREVERELISAALSATGGNRTRAAERLGISRRNLIRKLQSLNLDNAPDGGATG